MGPLTGFAMNPARDFGPKLMTFLAGWGEIAFTGGRDMPYFLVPVFAPILGACLGAATYRGLIARNLPMAAAVNPETNDNRQGDTQVN
ncbi:Glycerol uptake facilitator protein [compost metagenome]